MEKIKTLIHKYKYLSEPKSLGLIIFGVVALMITWSGVGIVQRNYELDKEIAVKIQQNDIARLENENLKLRNQYYESDLYLELSARRQFGKAEPGETLYIIPEEVALSNTKNRPASEKEAEQTDDRPEFQKNLEAWRDFLF